MAPSARSASTLSAACQVGQPLERGQASRDVAVIKHQHRHDRSAQPQPGLSPPGHRCRSTCGGGRVQIPQHGRVGDVSSLVPVVGDQAGPQATSRIGLSASSTPVRDPDDSAHTGGYDRVHARTSGHDDTPEPAVKPHDPALSSLPVAHGGTLRPRLEAELGFKASESGCKPSSSSPTSAHLGSGHGGYEDHEFFGYRMAI